MTPHVLIHTIVEQTVVFIAQLATAGGVRAPLAQVADQVFSGLAQELRARGVRQNVIADMFGLAVRTYHRRLQSAEQSRSVEGRTVWAAVLEYIRQQQPISAAKVQGRFGKDEPEVVGGVLRDLTDSGLVFRAGRGPSAVFRVAEVSDFDDDTDSAVIEHLLWQVVYRSGPLNLEQLSASTGLSPRSCEQALSKLLEDGRVMRESSAGVASYRSERFEVMPHAEHGWEAAVLDHYQAMLNAIRAKLSGGSPEAAYIGGSTWSFDVWPGHPLEQRAKDSLGRIRNELSALRAEIDQHNAAHAAPIEGRQRVIAYAGQNVVAVDAANDELNGEGEESK